MEAFVASGDPVLQRAAHIAGFAQAMVQDTDAGKVVLCRHHYSTRWVPFGHLEEGECALTVFYGTAWWERADVLGMYEKQEEQKTSSRASTKADISKDFRKDLHKLVARRPEGRYDLVDAMVRTGLVRR